MVMVQWMDIYVNTYQIIHVKYEQFIVHQFCLNKTAK